MTQHSGHEDRRKIRRYGLDLAVDVTTVLETRLAILADLSEKGAKLIGVSVPPGARLQIDYAGQTVFAQSRWSEIDRTGVEFLEALTEGPLFARLEAAHRADAVAARVEDAIRIQPDVPLGPMRTGDSPFAASHPCRCLNWSHCSQYGVRPDCLRLRDRPGDPGRAAA
jgi:hypothetical protein